MSLISNRGGSLSEGIGLFKGVIMKNIPFFLACFLARVSWRIGMVGYFVCFSLLFGFDSKVQIGQCEFNRRMVMILSIALASFLLCYWQAIFKRFKKKDLIRGEPKFIFQITRRHEYRVKLKEPFGSSLS